MKKISNYILAAFAAIPMLAGCNIAEFGDQHIYKPGEQDVEGCYGVYFPTQEASGSHIYDPKDPRTITVTAKRTNTKGDITVPVVLTASEKDIFVVNEISFLDGSDETSFDIDFANAQLAIEYSLTIQVVDKQYASNYTQNATSLDLKVLIVKWEKFFGSGATEATSKGTFTQVCWEEEYKVDMYYYDSPYPNIRACKLENGWQGNKATVDMIFYWNTTSNVCYVPQQWMGYVTTAGSYVYSGAAPDFYNAYYSWGMVCPSTEYFEWAPKWIEKNEMLQPHYDGNGGFYLGDWTYGGSADGVPTGSGWQFGGDSEMDMDLFVAAGFDRSEYDVRAMETDYTVDGKTPVYIQVGKTSKAIKYATVKGTLTKTTAAYVAQDIIDGKIGTIVTELEEDEDEDGKPVVSTLLQLEFDETADYSIVAVTFADKECTTKEAKANDYLNFYHVTKADTEKYAVKVTVGAEDTPSRYTAYTKYNSFQTYVVGTDITKACVYVIATKAYEAQKDAYNAFIKAGCPDAKGNTYYVTDDVLAEINQDGGYCTIVDGRTVLTSYTVVVWATNDKEDVIKTAEYTTDGLPLVKLGSGTYTYNGFYKGSQACDFYSDPNYKDKYVIEGWPDSGRFNFTWDGETTVSVNYTNSLEISYGSYGEVFCKEDVLVSATPKLGPSSYDPTTKTFTFNLAFFVSAGILTRGSETYAWTPDGELKLVSRNIQPILSGKPDATNFNKEALPKQFNFNECKKVERIPQTVDCKATFGTIKPNFNVKPSTKAAEKASDIKSVEKF